MADLADTLKEDGVEAIEWSGEGELVNSIQKVVVDAAKDFISPEVRGFLEKLKDEGLLTDAKTVPPPPPRGENIFVPPPPPPRQEKFVGVQVCDFPKILACIPWSLRKPDAQIIRKGNTGLRQPKRVKPRKDASRDLRAEQAKRLKDILCEKPEPKAKNIHVLSAPDILKRKRTSSRANAKRSNKENVSPRDGD